MKKSLYARRASGFSVVELMVSVVVGLVAVMFATRLLVGSEQTKSAAIGGSDSMQNGMLALFQINSDAAQAGWGINDVLLTGCNTLMQDSQGYQLTTVTRGGVNITPLSPVVIQNGGQGSDVISTYSGSSLSGMGNVVLGSAYAGGSTLTPATNTPFGFTTGDVIVVAPEPAGGNCSISQLSAQPAGPVMNIAGGANFRFTNGALGGGLYQQGQARIYNLGRGDKLAFHTWSVGDGRLLLRATDLAGTAQNPQTVIDNVVAIKAQYGFDTRPAGGFSADTMQVGVWSADMIDVDGDAVAGSAGDFQRIAAIRLAVVARNTIPEKPNAATGACTATVAPLQIFNSSVPANVAAAPLDVRLSVAGDPIDWTCYRYRAFETIVPIRNSGWRP